MAASTLANSSHSHQSLADIVRSPAPPSYAKLQPKFQVFATEKLEYHWRVVALATNRTVFRHKNLPFALKKCTWLNDQRREAHAALLQSRSRASAMSTALARIEKKDLK